MADVLFPVLSGAYKRLRDMGDGSWAEVHAASAYGVTRTALTIPSGAAVPTSGIDLAGLTPVGIWMPSAWTTAVLTFSASADVSPRCEINDAYGGEVTAQAAASRRIALDPALFLGMPYLRVRSGTTGTPVNQAADRVLTLVARVL